MMNGFYRPRNNTTSSYSPNDPRGSGAGMGTGTANTVTRTPSRNPMAGYEDYAPAYFDQNRPYWNEQNYDPVTRQMTSNRESRNPFDTGYNEMLLSEERLLEKLQGLIPSGGGGGTGYGNLAEAIGNVPGVLNFQPQMIPNAPVYNPQLFDPSQIQQYSPTLMNASDYEQFTPEELAYMNFDPMRQNIDVVQQQTDQMIQDAFAPVRDRLSQPFQSASGQISPTATQLGSDYASFARAMGIEDPYAGQVAGQNDQIAAGAGEFANRANLIAQAQQGRREGFADTAALDESGRRSQLPLEAMLLKASIDAQEARNVFDVDTANTGARNEADAAWQEFVRAIGMNNTNLQNQADQYNTGVANDAYFQNVGLGNEASMFNIGNQMGIDASNVANTNQGRQFDIGNILNLIIQGAGMGQTPNFSGMVA